MVTPPRRSRVAETLTVAGTEAYEMLLSFRLLFLVTVYAGAGAFVAWVWTSIDSEGQLTEMSKRLAELDPDERAERIQRIQEQGNAFLDMVGTVIFDPTMPPLAVTVLEITSFMLPLLILVVGYNRIAEDIETRYTRYILQRVHRESYLAGKIIGHTFVCLVAVIVVQVLWMLVAQQQELYGADRLFGSVPRVWIGMIVFVGVYSAYTMMVSAVFGRPTVALMLGTMILYAIWLAAFIASFVYAPLQWVWLSSWYSALWRLDLAAFGVFALYTLVFVFLAGLFLRRADL